MECLVLEEKVLNLSLRLNCFPSSSGSSTDSLRKILVLLQAKFARSPPLSVKIIRLSFIISISDGNELYGSLYIVLPDGKTYCA